MDSNPILENRSLAQPSTCSDQRGETKQPGVPPAIRRLIAELGLRYPPSGTVSAEQHAGQLALLARDLADMDPRDLEMAIEHHVRSSPYMPKASDLRLLAVNLAAQARKGKATEIIARGNEGLRKEKRPDLEWFTDGNGHYGIRPIERRRGYEPPCTPAEAAAIMAEFGLKNNPAERA